MIKINQTESQKQPILDKISGQVSNRLRFKILQAALAVHILVISCPFVWNLFDRILNPPKKKIINVRLVTQLPAAPSETSSSAKGGAPTPPAIIPNMPKVSPRPRPKPIKPPPIKPVSPPQIQPKVQPKAPPKIQPPTPPKVQPKVQPKSAPKAKPKPQPKTPPKPTPPAEPEKTFIPITEDPRAVSNQAETTQVPQVVSNQARIPQGPPGDDQEGEKFQLDYTQFVGQYLKANWEPPSVLQLGGDTPEVTVRIWLSPAGNITQWQLIKSSGNTLVDNSVKNLFFKIRKLPHPPPKGVTDLTLLMEIKKD